MATWEQWLDPKSDVFDPDLAEMVNPEGLERTYFRGTWEPSVLVIVERDTTRYFSLPTADHLRYAALEIVLQRLDYGWYQRVAGFAVEPKGPSMTKDEASALPEGPIRQAALTERHRRITTRKQWREDRAIARLLERVLETRDPNLALMYLDVRKDWEDEGYDVIVPETVTIPTTEE